MIGTSMVRGRFAPTPSGALHLGNAFVALLAWLQIRAVGGTFLLRVEDIDKPRSSPELARQQLADLRWLGIDWDEGPDIGGPYAPYTQSERLASYEQALTTLLTKQALYPCYCSRAELRAIARAPHGLAQEGPTYPGTCRALSAAEQQANALRKTPALRFLVTPEARRRIALQTARELPSWDGGDFVVRRADGVFSYQLAVVVDDAHMGITHVLRGADLADSTPRQLLLYDALGLKPPHFTHVPLLCDASGRRLAKRSADLSIQTLRANGCSAETIVGLLGTLSGLLDRFEPLRAKELISYFRTEALVTEPVLLTPERLALLDH